MNDEQKKQLAFLLEGEPAPRRKPGKPPIALAETFEAQMQALTPDESSFVRHILAGSSAFEAYGRIRPHTADQTRRNHGARWMARKGIAHALALGKKQGAIAAIAGLAYDVKAADAQLVQLIDEARHSDQYSAVSNLVRERLKLWKLTDNAPAAVAGASFTLVIKAADGSEQTLTPGHVIDIQPTNKEVTSADEDQ